MNHFHIYPMQTHAIFLFKLNLLTVIYILLTSSFNSFTKLNFLRIPRISYIHYCSAISYPYVNAKLHSTQPIFIQSIDDYWSDLRIMMMAVIRSSMSRMGLFMPRSSLSFSMSMFWMTFLVSATMAMALYTALSWATWYSGSNCKILRDMFMKIDLLIAIHVPVL